MKVSVFCYETFLAIFVSFLILIEIFHKNHKFAEHVKIMLFSFYFTLILFILMIDECQHYIFTLITNNINEITCP
jgi:hypothetical protein